MKIRLQSGRWLVFFVCLFVFAGCEIKRPKEIIPESKMEKLLYDYHIAKVMSDNVRYEESYKRALYIKSVFDKYDVTESQFDSSMVWYTRNLEVLTQIYEKVNVRLKGEKEGLNHLIATRDKKPKTSEPGDSIDVWGWRETYRLVNVPTANRLSFVLPIDTNFQARDTLDWQVQYRFIGHTPDSADAVIMSMQIVYENDSMIYHTKSVLQSGAEHIRLSADTLGKIKETKGFIYYPLTQKIGTLFLSGLSINRYHAKDSISHQADSLNVLKADSLKKDSLKEKTVEPEKVDTLRRKRINPEDLNRERTGGRRNVPTKSVPVRNVPVPLRELKPVSVPERRR